MQNFLRSHFFVEELIEAFYCRISYLNFYFFLLFQSRSCRFRFSMVTSNLFCHNLGGLPLFSSSWNQFPFVGARTKLTSSIWSTIFCSTARCLLTVELFLCSSLEVWLLLQISISKELYTVFSFILFVFFCYEGYSSWYLHHERRFWNEQAEYIQWLPKCEAFGFP